MNSFLLCYVWEDQLFLALYGSTIIQTRLFLKNIKNFVWFPKQYLLGFLFLDKQLANISDRGFLFLRNTLLLVCLAGAQSLLRPEKKSFSHLSGGCVIVITTRKKKF